MKKYIIAAMLTIILAAYAWATLSSVTQASMGRNSQSFTQTQTVVGVAEATVFSPRIIAPYTAWSVWVFNNGVGGGALTDLNIYVSDENANWDEAAELIAAATAGAGAYVVNSTNCTTTLANDAKCVYSCTGGCPPFGWIELTATATTTTEVKVVFIGRID